MEKKIDISVARLLEITDDYNLKYLITEDDKDKHLMLEYDNSDQKWHCTLEFTQKMVESSGIPLYNFYTDDKGNYYYPIVMEPEYVE